jgi:hypothetical protein
MTCLLLKSFLVPFPHVLTTWQWKCKYYAAEVLARRNMDIIAGHVNSDGITCAGLQAGWPSNLGSILCRSKRLVPTRKSPNQVWGLKLTTCLHLAPRSMHITVCTTLCLPGAHRDILFLLPLHSLLTWAKGISRHFTKGSQYGTDAIIELSLVI